MAYGNYWRQYEDFTTKEWDTIQAEVREIILAASKDGIRLGDGHGEDKPIVDDTQIFLNGFASESYETFSLTPSMDIPKWSPFAAPEKCERGFCKTQQRPYDVVVTSILRMVHDLAPQKFHISSDGGTVVRTY